MSQIRDLIVKKNIYEINLFDHILLQKIRYKNFKTYFLKTRNAVKEIYNLKFQEQEKKIRAIEARMLEASE